MSNTESHLLVRAARGETVERPPVWAMRQAGRWDPEFNRVRAGMPFYEFSENVELAAEASLLPKRFGVDGIILFYDITTLPVSMGLPFSLQPGIGPVPAQAVQTIADVENLEPEVQPESFSAVRQLLKRVRESLQGELPVLVFAGAPFTVATYCIGTGKDMDATRKFASEKADVWQELLQRLTVATERFLKVLADEGASAYQLFDSWAGLLELNEYGQWAHPYHQRILESACEIPRILFVKECPYLDLLAESGADVISLGQVHDLAQARRQYPNLSFQGNVSQELLRNGTPEEVTLATRRCVEEGGGHRHIVNLDHGVDKATPVANFEAFVQAVRG